MKKSWVSVFWKSLLCWGFFFQSFQAYYLYYLYTYIYSDKFNIFSSSLVPFYRILFLYHFYISKITMKADTKKMLMKWCAEQIWSSSSSNHIFPIAPRNHKIICVMVIMETWNHQKLLYHWAQPAVGSHVRDIVYTVGQFLIDFWSFYYHPGI